MVVVQETKELNDPENLRSTLSIRPFIDLEINIEPRYLIGNADTEGRSCTQDY